MQLQDRGNGNLREPAGCCALGGVRVVSGAGPWNHIDMVIEVAFSKDPARMLTEARVCLASEPVLHNVILTLLHERATHPEPGRYSVAINSGAVVSVVFQSPSGPPGRRGELAPRPH